MRTNEIDKFRQDFFNKVIADEKEKERIIKEKQRKCFHNYNIMEPVGANGYQKRTCSKCDHYDVKSIRVWNNIHVRGGSSNCIVI
jgi:hypothetical protein